MSNARRLIRYPEERALEDVAYGQRAVPTRIFPILLPVWPVTIRATVTEREAYELIDRHLELGFATADLGTPDELANFFGLDVVVVDRAVRFLNAIGHLASHAGRLVLTDIGQRSVQDNVRYVVSHQDRRTLYFDGFGSRPLPAAYYDTRTVTLLSGAKAIDAADSGEWPRFKMLYSMSGFRQEALTELASNSQRAHFNLPERIDNPELLETADLVFLPMYVVRALQQGNRLRLFAYTQVGDQADQDITDLCEQTPDLTGVLEAEERICDAAFYSKACTWLREQGLSEHGPERLDDGTWRITLPGSSFGEDSRLSLSKVGSFIVRANDILHVWCDDTEVRYRALLARADAYLSVRANPDRTSTEERITRIADQLALGTIDLPRLRQLAGQAGMKGLADQLGSLT